MSGGGTIPWLSVVDFNSDARFVEDTVEKITQEGLEKSSTKLLDKGQLIISARGTVGCLAQLTKPMAFNQSCYGLDGKTGVVENNYLYYLIKLKVTELKQKTHGAVFDTITRETFNHIDVDIPDDPDVRRKIAKTLGDLDKKIATNTQTKQTLEQIAQAIFKSWFVDFEPVKAKVAVLEAGGTAEQAELAAMSAISAKDEATLKQLQAEQPDAYTELAQTAALFPSAMDESELGEIPEGWEASGLESCTIELRRGISPKYTEEGGIRVINQKCIRNHTVDFTLARRNDPSKRKIEGREIEVGDVLVNSTGVGTLGRLAPVRYLDETTVVDSHVTVVRADTGKISKSFLSGLMIVNESFIEASGAGSTGQTELRKQVLEDIRFAQPSPEIDSKYDFIVSHMSPQIAELEKQRSTLASTRDSLLPKLLAGDLQVTNTDEELA
ncbi:MAG: restriction endonuclease subunit S [Candidatus Sedimenticola sp. 6PFRAG7]